MRINPFGFRLRLVLSLLTAVAITLIPFGAAMAQSQPTKDHLQIDQKPLIIGHRGAAGLRPENTLAGFKVACDLGVDGIELDLLVSADGELVVHHDYALNPDTTRNDAGDWIDPFSQLVINELSLSELKRYDVGRLQPYTPYAAKYPVQKPADGAKIPTFREAIALFKQSCAPSTLLFVEIKTSPEKSNLTPPPEKISEKVVTALKEAGLIQRSWILSFDWRNLVHVQKIAPELTTVYLTITTSRTNTLRSGLFGGSPWMAGFNINDYDGSPPKAIKAAGGNVWSPYYRNLTPALLKEAHDLGLTVSVWTPDSASDLKKMMKLGVDAITTNRPDILLKITGRESQQP